MVEPESLRIPYNTHPRVKRLREGLRYVIEGFSLEFDQWGEPHVHGPGVYLAIAVGPDIGPFADPMGDNQWPVDADRDAVALSRSFTEGLKDVAYTADGAVVISVDGIVSPQLVRFSSVDTPQNLSYAPWMGSRHMSALDISTRRDIVGTVTLSQESGRVTVFADGSYESLRRHELGRPYRAE